MDPRPPTVTRQRVSPAVEKSNTPLGANDSEDHKKNPRSFRSNSHTCNFCSNKPSNFLTNSHHHHVLRHGGPQKHTIMLKLPCSSKESRYIYTL